jgi:hypothetical protein
MRISSSVQIMTGYIRKLNIEAKLKRILFLGPPGNWPMMARANDEGPRK